MAPYNYNNFYDPVGSQANQQQPQGYTYSTNNTNNPPTSTAQYPNQSSYQTSYGSNSYNTQYGSQAYGTAPSQPQPQSTSNSSRAASALSALTPQDYSTTSRTANTASQYNSSTTWNDPQQSYNNTNPAYSQSSRSQANQSPLYQTSSASTFGRLSLPEQSQTSSSNTVFPTTSSNASTQSSYQNAPSSAASQHRQYMTAYTQQQNTQPPPDRYASPLHAVQAQQRQQSHNRQTSRSSNPQPSPQTAARNLQHHNQQQQQQQQQQQNQRQQSASVEPSPTTVDPSQVYDFRAEQERKVRIDTERRKKIEAEKAARKAEQDARQKVIDDRKAAEEARVAELERVESERKKAEEDAKKAEEEASKQQQARERKNEQRRKAREEKRQSKTAATALQQMASGAGSTNGSSSNNDGQAASMAMMAAMMGDQSQPPANDEEAEMRAMFAKMREFNAKNPALLAKMWEEERTAHAVSPAQPAAQAVAPPPANPPATSAKRGAGKTQQARQQPKNAPTTSTPASASPAQPYQPFTGVNSGTNNGKAPVKASSTPQQSAPQPAGNTSLWPPHKKGSLAEAAAKWLASRPENANTGFTITREEVLKILDSNPSYVQLCEMIEKTGVKFERSALAKELLKAVPDGLRNPTSGKPSAGSPSNGMTAQMNAAAGPRKRGPNKPKSNYTVPNQGGRPTANGTVSYQSPSFSSLADAARAVNGMSTAPTYPSNSLASALGGGAVQSPMDGPYFDQPINVDDDYQPVGDSTPAPVYIKPEEPPRPPADKEEAARKRTFGDLVDLTGGDDSDDEGPPRKMLQPQRPNPVPIPSAVFNPLQRAQQIVQQNFGTQNIGQPAPYDPYMRQNGYGRPTPHHSNAATPVPPAQVLKSRGPTQEQLQHERMRGKVLVEPIMRDRVARRSKYDVRTIARDVLLATGRHPDMRALNAHLNSMQKLLGDHGGVVDGAGNKSDLSTIKWQYIDPGEPVEEAKAKVEAAKKRADDSDATEEADDESEKPSRISTPAETVPSSTNHHDKSSAAQMRGSAPNEHFIKKKRGPGRPKGFRPAFAKKNKDQSAADPAASSSKPTDATSVTSPTVDTTSPTRTTRKRRTDSISTPVRGSPANKDNTSPNMSSGGAVGYAAFREIDANGNVIKKKGRPVGWRKNVHSREAQGLTPAKAGSKPLGSKLRQSTTASTPTAIPQRREYAVYACQWAGCKSELDGLERLKKHILKIHGAANDDGDFECLWEGCKNVGKHVDGKGKVRDGSDEGGAGTFEDIEQWLGHVDKVHLEAVGWKLGDGMRGEAYTPDPNLYLSDSTGRSLTPIIQPPSPSPASTIKPPYDPYGILPHGNSREEIQAGKELEKLRRIKVKEGGLLGREGSILANAKRRKGFLDDEDFWEIFEGSGDEQ